MSTEARERPRRFFGNTWTALTKTLSRPQLLYLLLLWLVVDAKLWKGPNF